jgi:hypothetical protein
VKRADGGANIVMKHANINVGGICMAVTQEEYNRKYHQEMARHGVTRDEAVRSTNVACGYGDSTALQYPVTDEAPPPEAQPKGE